MSKPPISTLFNDESSTADTKHACECLLLTHQCINSLWDVNMRGNQSYHFPTNLMHIMSTIMKTVFQLLTDPLSVNEKASLDVATNEIMGNLSTLEKEIMCRA